MLVKSLEPLGNNISSGSRNIIIVFIEKNWLQHFIPLSFDPIQKRLGNNIDRHSDECDAGFCRRQNKNRSLVISPFFGQCSTIFAPGSGLPLNQRRLDSTVPENAASFS